MFSSDGCRAKAPSRTQTIARTLLASAFLLGVAPAINAQPFLQITQAYAGNFNQFGITNNCSSVSPQFNNLPLLPFPNPPLLNIPQQPSSLVTSVIPGACTNTIQLWVANTGNAASAGLITVNINLAPESPRSLTTVSANGFTAAPGSVNPGTAAGWACAVFRNFVTCTSSAAIAAGKSSTAITLTVLLESIFPAPPQLNVSSGVSGGGMAGSGFGAFDVIERFPDSVPGQGAIKPLSVNGTRLAIHTVPEGLGMNVDGVQDPTPHFFFYTLDTVHTFLEPGFVPAALVFSRGLVNNDPTCLTASAPSVPPYGPVWSTPGPPAQTCAFDPATFLFGTSAPSSIMGPAIELVIKPSTDLFGGAAGTPIYTYVVAVR